MRKIKYSLLALLIITPLFLLVVNQSYAFFGRWQTKVGNPPPPGEAPPPPDGGSIFGPRPTCSNVVKRLKDDFGVTVRSGGPASGGWATYKAENVGCSIRIQIYKSLKEPAKSPGFRKRLKARNPWVIQCYVGGLTNGEVVGSNKILVQNCGYSFVNYPRFSFFLLHEVGHLIKWRNPRDLRDGFPLTRFVNRDPGCFRGYAIKTYSGNPPYTTQQISEAMAEATGLYVYNSKVGKYARIDNFKIQCDDMYAWMKNNVYGNYEFN